MRSTAPGCRVILAALLIGTTVIASGATESPQPSETPDLGVYSREATEAAKARLKDTLVAVFAGGRHGYIKGERVSLDPDRWRTEAIVAKGKVMVPERFALTALGLKDLPWLGLGIAQKGKMVALADVAAKQKKEVFTDERGLVLVTEEPLTLSDSPLIDSIITLFDTPEKFADPQIAYRNLPSLKAWGKLGNQIKATDEQLKAYEGPETEWKLVAKKDYDLSGVRLQELASEVPVAGVHPRVLFGPDDVPTIASRVRASVTGSKSLVEMEYLFGKSFLDPNTSDGQVFAKLGAGDVEGLELEGHTFKGQKPGIFSSHVAYVPNCLTSMALYCLLTNNEALGKRTGNAIYHYYKLLEPQIDSFNDQPEVYRTHWRGMHDLVAHMDLGLAYDFSATWMTDEQKALMRRVISKAVAGRRGYGQDGPARTRDVNWVTWDLTIFLANLAIEGEAGFDPEIYESGLETVRAFLQWGIDAYGLPYESNGKSGGGLEFQLLSMVALARRGENMFGHPHWRKLMEAQVQCTAPDRQVTASRGTWGSRPLDRQTVTTFKVFYPQDKYVDFLLGPAGPGRVFDAEAYRQQLPEKPRPMRLPGPTYPGMTKTVLYDADGAGATRADLDLPLDFSDPVQGMLSSRSDDSETALWINMQARPDLYLGAGHMHHDAGSIYLQADGVTWGRDSLSPEGRASKDHSVVLIDGVGQDGDLGERPVKVRYLGAVTEEQGAIATADIKYAYDYVWTTQIARWDAPHAAGYEWELEPDPEVVKIFKGTQRYRVNYWWGSMTNPWFPTLRAPFNPVQYAFRSAGLVRGKHPYAIVVDDIRKDDESHDYTWQMIGGFHTVTLPSLGPEDLALSAVPGPNVPPGTLMLLVREVGPSTCTLANSREQERTVVSARAIDPKFRLLLIPFRMGDALPQTVAGGGAGAVGLRWDDQADRLLFEVGDDQRTRICILRDGKEILRSK